MLVKDTTRTGCKHSLNDPTGITSEINSLALTSPCSPRTSGLSHSLRLSHSFRPSKALRTQGVCDQTNGSWRYCQWMLPHRRPGRCIIQGKDILVTRVTNKSLPKGVPRRAVCERQAALACSTSVLPTIFRKMNFLGRQERNLS